MAIIVLFCPCMSNLIKYYRKKNRLTQKELAIKCNVKQSYISQLENNLIIPSIPMIIKISKVFNICPIKLSKDLFCYNCSFKKYCNKDCLKNPNFNLKL